MIRSKNRIQDLHKLKEGYKEVFLKKVKDGSVPQVPYSIYKKICIEANNIIMDKIIHEGKIFEMPYRLGRMYVRKRKVNTDTTKTMKIDFKKTKELGKTVYHLNTHTNGFFMKFHWNKIRGYVKNISRFCYKPTRYHTNGLAAAIKTNNYIDFFE